MYTYVYRSQGMASTGLGRKGLPNVSMLYGCGLIHGRSLGVGLNDGLSCKVGGGKYSLP